MKLSGFLILFSVLQVLAVDSYSQHTKLTLDLKNVTIEDALKTIEDQSEFFFLYSPKMVDVSRKVDIELADKKVDFVLNQMFAGTGVDYVIKDRQIVITTDEMIQPFKKETPQQIVVTGNVTDEDGNTLPGVNIIIKGTLKGFTTDADGNYTLQVDSPDAILVFSFLGYRTQEVTVDNQTQIDVTMVTDIIGLEEVIAIGYGSQRRNDLTGSITSVNSEQLEPTLNTNLFKSLQGTVAGLRITQNNFEPGASQEIRIRGENSLSASNNPLIILDGIPYTGDMNDINPYDIESVSILKDASSTAIYGARSANGVIIVTTKTGKPGKLSINFNSTVGLSSVANKSIEMLDGDGYISFIQDKILYEGGSANQDPSEWLFSNAYPQYQAGTETDWLDLVFRTALVQDQLLSMSGGTKETTYYTSVGYLDEPGIVENSGFERITLRSNVRHDLNDWLTVGSNLQFSHTDSDGGGATPSVSFAMRQTPYGKLKEDNGDYTFYPQFPETYFPNPFADDDATVDDISKQALINLFAEIKPTFIPGLSYRLNYGTDFRITESGTYYPSTSLSGFAYSGVADKRTTTNNFWTLENILRYDNSWGNHNLAIVGLYSREATTGEYSRQTGRGFVNDDNLYYYINSAETKDAYTELMERSLVSYMGRLHYDYAKKYLLTITARQDGYSGFGEDNKFGFFPSAALGWTISNEEFAQNMGVEFLKLRLSYGVNGNQAVDPYQTLDRLRDANTLFGDNTAVVNGLKINAVGNPDLKWEGTTTFDIGLDFAFLQNKISGTIDFYSSNSQDLLMTRQVPVMNGYTSIWYNIGETENKGVEISLNTRNITKSDFTWISSFTFSLNRDKIVALRGEGIDDIANQWFIGEPLRVHYGYEYDGLWAAGEEEEFAAYAPDGTFEAHLGKPKVKDINKDGEITEEDRAVLGSQLPSWTGGMFNELKYKDWSLSVFVNTVQGIYRSNDWYYPQSFQVEKNMNYLDVDYWRLDRPSDEFISAGIVYDAGYPSAGPLHLKNASFVRIQNVTLSYEFPRSVIGEKISKLRIFLSAHNLFTFSSWLGWDPEAGTTSALTSLGTLYPSAQVPYPSARTFRFGINLGL